MPPSSNVADPSKKITSAPRSARFGIMGRRLNQYRPLMRPIFDRQPAEAMQRMDQRQKEPNKFSNDE
jgi:hypothetical protein